MASRFHRGLSVGEGVDDLTALIGKNDVGKSTVLEALDIFFNQIKIDIGDRNVLHVDEETVVGCIPFFEAAPVRCIFHSVLSSRN